MWLYLRTMVPNPGVESSAVFRPMTEVIFVLRPSKGRLQKR